METWQIILFVLIGIVFVLGCIVAVLFYVVVPKKLIIKIRGNPQDDDNITFPANYNEYENKVSVTKNHPYSSTYHNNKYDIYKPKNILNKCPIVIWVHGGFYFAGRKEGVRNLATFLAAHGVAVIAIDYALAPENKYPTAIYQLNEFTEYILQNQDPDLDFNKIYYAGDSAGGQIAAQYVAIVNNPQLSNVMAIKPAITSPKIKGGIFVCAPLDLGMLRKKSKKMAILLKMFARQYFGKQARKKDKIYEEVKVSNHINANYPPTFLTDGNHYSFEDHCKSFGQELRSQ